MWYLALIALIAILTEPDGIFGTPRQVVLLKGARLAKVTPLQRFEGGKEGYRNI